MFFQKQIPPCFCFFYALNNFHRSLQHCAGINCVAVLKSSATSDNSDYLFTGSQDGTLKRWALSDDAASCLATFESHVDWVLFLIQSIPILYSLASVLLALFFFF